MQMTVEVQIEAPPDVVFATLADVPRWPEHIASITHIEMLTAGPVARGARFRETRMMFGREAAEEMTVAEIEPPRRFVLTAHNHGTAYRMVHDLTPDGRSTRLTLVFEGRPVTLAARLMSPVGWLMAGTIKAQMARDFEDLKRAIETGSAR